MITVLFPLAAVVAGLSLVYKLNHLLRTPRDSALATLCLVFASSALVFTLTAPAVAAEVDRLLGLPGIAFAGRTTLTIVLLTSEQLLLTHWISPATRTRTAARVALVLGCATVAVMLVLFVLAQTVTDGSTQLLYGRSPSRYLDVYLTVYVVACMGAEAQISRLCRRHARHVGRLWLRRGLRLVAVGAMLTLLFGLVRALEVLGVPVGPLGKVGLWCGSAGVLAKLVGWTLPSWGPSATALSRWAASYRDLLRLRPLWLSLYRANPGIALDEPRSRLAEVLSVLDVEYRTCRRIIEIRDGLVALSPYLPPPTDSDDPDAEAVRITEGLRVHASARAPHPKPRELTHRAAATDIAGELRWLTRVSRAFDRAHPSPG